MALHRAHEKMDKLRHALGLHKLHPLARKMVVAVLGGLCLGAGLVMIFTPGPAFVFIPLGILLLAGEFKWAEPWARRILGALRQMRARWRLRRRRRARAAAAKLVTPTSPRKSRPAA